MRTAPPPVEVTLPAGRRERALVAALYAMTAAVLAGWLVQRGDLIGAMVLWLATPTCGALVGWSVLRPLRGHLRWDGGAWSCRTGSHEPFKPCRVRLQWDLGGWMLLRVHGSPGERTRWCAIAAAQAGRATWHGLRLALYQHSAEQAIARGGA